MHQFNTEEVAEVVSMAVDASICSVVQDLSILDQDEDKAVTMYRANIDGVYALLVLVGTDEDVNDAYAQQMFTFSYH